MIVLFQAYLKGNIPRHQWTSQILLLKSHWWNKNETKHGYELWTNIDDFSVLFPQSLWHKFLIYGAHKTEKMNAFNKKILRFHRIMVLHKYVVTIFSLLWFWVVAAAHRVVMDSLCVWLCHLSGGSIFFRHHSWCSYLLLIGLNYYCTRSCFYLLSRSSKK